MTKKLTYDEVKSYIESFGYKLLDPEYKNNKTKLTLQCEKGHEYEARYNDFKTGKRCPICVDTTLTYNEVKEYIESFNYKLLSPEYVNALTKLKLQCENGHQYEANYNNFKRGCRCPICANLNKSGENHPNWNPNREYVKKQKQVHQIASNLLHRCLQLSNKSKTNKTEQLLGYSRKELKEHLESFDLWNESFTNPELQIHIDHIIPIKAFVDHGYNCENLEDIKIINHLSNLQVLVGVENMSKKDSYLEEDFQKYIEKFN